MHASPPHARTSAHAGFTLLEVMFAFAILAILTGAMAQMIHNNMEKAGAAIDQRELRELADTLFGKILFEQADHRDGDEGSIAVDYGQWAGLPQERADRYSIYRWRLKKTEMVAAGTTDPDDDAEGLFGDDSDDDEDSGSSSGSSVNDADKGSVKLMRFTLSVFREDDPDQPLIVLSRFLPPPEYEGSGSSK
ncbi:MAG: prepilin-type N-terminal cleavage/methylation domain-containing protein [Planctomycetota bacterium]|nr:prepilin-type N-terminal cleavage/methylation domain-containing protein [Planctomycetota bacterium]